MARDDDQRTEDPAEVIQVATRLMEEDRARREPPPLGEIADELGVPRPYIDRAVAELQRRRAARGRRVVIAGALGVVALAGAAAGVLSTRPHPAGRLAGVTLAFDLGHGSGSAGAAAAVERDGARVRTIEQPLSDETLRGVGVLCLFAPRKTPFTSAELDAMERFVRGGGGLIAAELGWSWTYYVHQPIEALPLNQLGARLGFGFTAENIGVPARVDPDALAGLGPLVRHDWVPSSVTLTGAAARELVHDDQLRLMAGTVEAGRGRVAAFGHPTMLTENPGLFAWAVRWAARR
jgi:hypothetical protein